MIYALVIRYLYSNYKACYALKGNTAADAMYVSLDLWSIDVFSASNPTIQAILTVIVRSWAFLASSNGLVFPRAMPGPIACMVMC